MKILFSETRGRELLEKGEIDGMVLGHFCWAKKDTFGFTDDGWPVKVFRGNNLLATKFCKGGFSCEIAGKETHFKNRDFDFAEKRVVLGTWKVGAL